MQTGLLAGITNSPGHGTSIVLFAMIAVLVTSPNRLCAQAAATQTPEHVTAIKAPAAPLPPEAKSGNVKRFSFIVYGDTRESQDGIAIQLEHSLVVNSMLAQIKRLRATMYPVRFVLQSGDVVLNGRDAHQWNVSVVPVINRLIAQGNVPYFLVPGTHEWTTTPEGLRNYLDGVAALIPPEGSPRRLKGYTTFSFGFGNTFVIGLDGNIAFDEKQYQWVKTQLEGLDRSRYVNVFVFCHQSPFSSGLHGGPMVEPQTMALRERYMPLFHAHHVRAVFSGHEHLFEHWVEHYTDATGRHRMDLVVSGGGGAPLYPYLGEPDVSGYVQANASNHVELQHLLKPGPKNAPGPYHFVIVRVDDNRVDMQVVGVGRSFAPYGRSRVTLQDPSK